MALLGERETYSWIAFKNTWQPKRTEIRGSKTYVHKMVMAAWLFTIAKEWKQLRCPWADEWVKIMCCMQRMEY
jgi:hypothetical protein